MAVEQSRVRQPAVAGMFYPDNPDELRQMVQGFMDKAPVPDQDPVALVAPHAGYVYSGYTAACAYNSLPEADAAAPRRVFLLGPSHRVHLDGVSVGNYQAYNTPLGQVAIDQQKVAEMLTEPDIIDNPAPHQFEHSLEVHLPFIMASVKHFTLVPLVFGKMEPARLAQILDKYTEPNDLIIVSSDLSHYYPYDEARQLDGKCHAAMLGQQPGSMADCKACGNTGMTALLNSARGRKWQTTLADYRTSGDTAGDKAKVVGYASYLFYPDDKYIDSKWKKHPESGEIIDGSRAGSATKNDQDTDNRGKEMIALVREHLKRVLSGQPGLNPLDIVAKIPDATKNGATFITLNQNGQLRGCIGSLVAHRPLSQDLLENGVSAAVRDPRFKPVQSGDLDSISIEISILSNPEPLSYKNDLELLRKLKPGVHGVILTKNGKRGTFLPQVWEQLPTPRTFMKRLCQKAGLSESCWRDKPEIQVYTVKKYKESL
ncbi:MAG: AmmeMemoRadiSam system protein B [Magnetococcales bacterium]|nr:AmmeMemoRadiSam system protein B [Magnetococcales bacterium]